MPLRLSGLASGLDTESIIKDLMKAHRFKSTRIEKKITTLEWTQEKWKGLNTKLYSFYTGPLSKLRMQGSFNTKKTSSSNPNKVEITASSSAPEGTHTVQVKQMASPQFVTGFKLGNDINGKTITLNTKLTDLGFKSEEGTTITINTGSKEASLEIGSSTTINDFINKLKNAGLNANYDTVQKRFFISSKESGNLNAFSITTSSSEEALERNVIRDYLSYGTLIDSKKTAVDNALNTYIEETSIAEDKAEARTELLNIKHEQVRNSYIQAYIKDEANITAATDSERTRLEAELQEGETLDEAVLKAAVDAKLLADAQTEVTAEYDLWNAGTAPDTNLFKAAQDQLDTLLLNYSTDNSTVITQTNDLSLLGLSEIEMTTNPDGSKSVTADGDVILVQATDARIIYNNAELTSTSNTITANGLTFNLKGVTDDNETINLSVINDTQAVYDMVKSFVKSYNELLTELNSVYGAESAKGYDPLTDEEKESMSDSQIEKWEEKIKTSLLRRDTKLDSIISSMRLELSKPVSIDGKSYSLSSFGIGSVNYTEKGILHINGDSDDNLVSVKENDLMKALTENPETVMKALNELADNLYDNFTDKMRSTTLSSALTFYNDKELTKTITRQEEDLKVLERRLKDIEDRYYKQFAAMESAMSMMNSQSSQLMSMLGMNQQ